MSENATSTPAEREAYDVFATQEKWLPRWDELAPFRAGAAGDDRPKKYVLDMFPYPSGAGLHVGHPLGYIATDVFGRFKRMTGHHVLHAFGFDAFGLPAEQYAVQTGQHPRITTEANIAASRAQLRRLGLAHDERRSVATTDPAMPTIAATAIRVNPASPSAGRPASAIAVGP